jgi:GNAT superfamily N-acetyltransferase
MTDDRSTAVAPVAHSAPAPPAGGLRWIPIRSLAPRHRPRILAHLLALPEHDRYLRFGHAVSDEQVGRYVDQLDFDRDEIFGVFNRRLELVAMAHLAYDAKAGGQHRAAEFGISVLPRLRGRGFGGQLFDHAVLHARNRHVDTLIVHALAENTPMLRIARSAGARVEREGGDAEAVLKLPPETMATHFEEVLDHHAAELDYNFKRGARRVDSLLSLISEVRDGVGRSGGMGSQ